MSHIKKIYAFDKLLRRSRSYLPRKEMQERLGVSRATMQRLIKLFREDFKAPLEYNPRYRGYKLIQDGDSWELPGIRFTGKEIASLAGIIQSLDDLYGGLLDDEMLTLRKRVSLLLQKEKISVANWIERIKVLPVHSRPTPVDTLRKCAEGVLLEKVISMEYQSVDGETTNREVDPQSLIRYRDNWYLDAYCRLRKELRTFALSRIQRLEVTNGKAKRESSETLKSHFTTSYGIFAGPAKENALLRFKGEAAKRVSEEIWHPKQKGKWHTNGEYDLSFPYGDPRELIAEIMRFIPNVEILEPESLKNEVKGVLGVMR